jgi:pimeloyl-ACP methyl ester carboxylesterase
MTDVREFEVGGRHLWAERLGPAKGPAVVLLAGAAMQATTWESPVIEPFLAAGRSAIRFDWRDIGRSSWLRFRDTPYTIDDLAADVLAILDGYEIDVADVVGFSMGGCVAQLVTLAAPGRVRSLTLLSSGYASRIEVDRGERGRQLFELLAQPMPEDAEGQIRRHLAQWRLLCGRSFDFDLSEWEHRVRSWIARGQNPSCPHMRLGPQVLGVDRADQLAQLETPTWVLHGDDDPMFPLPHGQAIADTLPNSRITVHEGRGHDLYLDASLARSVAAGLP